MPEVRVPIAVDSVDACIDCFRACTGTIAHCLSLGGMHSEQPHVDILMDCAALCELAANFMLRDSVLSDQASALCAEACSLAVEECDRFPTDLVMQQCGQACRQCMEACKDLLP